MNADMGSEQDQDSFGAEFQNFYQIILLEDLKEIKKVAGDIIEVKGFDEKQFEFSIGKKSFYFDKTKAEIQKKMIKAIK